ncbi:MAG: hypothetical protein ACE1ZA_08670 [Pseudomonadales bacterium]
MINFRCLCFGHAWTGDAEQGIPPPEIDLEDVAAEFFRYARMWCKRCRRYMEPKPLMRGSEHWDTSVKYRPPFTEVTDDG